MAKQVMAWFNSFGPAALGFRFGALANFKLGDGHKILCNARSNKLYVGFSSMNVGLQAKSFL